MILDDEDVLIQAATDSVCYKMVDLGLPSGLKWANKNVGASSPEDTGLYFQWGDTIGYTADQVGEDKVFDWDNYKFGPHLKLTKYNLTDRLAVLESIDDAAITYMGSQNRMPTVDEIQELIYCTSQTFIDLDGREYSQEQAQNGAIKFRELKGVKLTGVNGNSIFIPAAGYCKESLLGGIGMYGGLWTSSLDDIDLIYARNLSIHSDGYIMTNFDKRKYGLCVRGVQDSLNRI